MQRFTVLPYRKHYFDFHCKSVDKFLYQAIVNLHVIGSRVMAEWWYNWQKGDVINNEDTNIYIDFTFDFHELISELAGLVPALPYTY